MIQNRFHKSLLEHQNLLKYVTDQHDSILEIAKKCHACVQNGNKIILAGNGGSASDAEHIAAEFVGRFVKDRDSLASIALTNNSALITAISNDYGFEEVFARQLKGVAKTGDIFIPISTSGNSPNLIRACEQAKSLNLETIALLGRDGGKLKNYVNQALIVPSESTARIQEMHILIAHLICEYIDGQY